MFMCVIKKTFLHFFLCSSSKMLALMRIIKVVLIVIMNCQIIHNSLSAVRTKFSKMVNATQ